MKRVLMGLWVGLWLIVAFTVNAQERDVCVTKGNQERPTLSGDTKRIETTNFIIHYTLQGIDATTRHYVTQMQDALEESLRIQLEELGWRLPPPDCGEGGDNRLDVYVMDLSADGVLGYVARGVVVGDNPFTPATERYAAYSYLVLDNDMSFASAREAINLMRTTAAHEIHHNIQFGYDNTDSFGAFYEAGATWIETLVNPEIADAYHYISDYYNTTDYCMGADFDDYYHLRMYGEWLLIDSFTRDIGRDSYQRIWEYLAVGEGIEGFYEALRRIGTTPESIISRASVRYLLGDFDYIERFPMTVKLDGALTGVGTVKPFKTGVQSLGVDYVVVEADGVYTLTSENRQMSLIFVGINTGTNTATVYELGRRGTIDTTRYDNSYVIVVNTSRHKDPSICRYEAWEISVTEGSGMPLTASTGEKWNAKNFVPPTP